MGVNTSSEFFELYCTCSFLSKDDFKKTSLSLNNINNTKYLQLQKQKNHRDNEAVDKDNNNKCVLPLLPSPKLEQQSIVLLCEKKGAAEKSLSPKKTPTEYDFQKIIEIGSGAFATVYKVIEFDTKTLFAMKIIDKKEMILKRKLHTVITERNILKDSLHPFIIKLRYAFQNERFFYFILDYLPGGDLQYYLAKYKVFPEKWVKFYAAEIILGIEYLHTKLKIIYRDLKPENILLDAEGHIRLTDFGLSKEGLRASTTCGTPEYIAPEVLKDSEYGREIDFWSFGCIIYQLLSGEFPFQSKDGNQESVFNQIINADVKFPEFMSHNAKDFIGKLLAKNPQERLGYNSFDEIKDHPFLDEINWLAILNKSEKSPIEPVMDREHECDDLPTLDFIDTN